MTNYANTVYSFVKKTADSNLQRSPERSLAVWSFKMFVSVRVFINTVYLYSMERVMRCLSYHSFIYLFMCMCVRLFKDMD